jgi:hypothetical protein
MVCPLLLGNRTCVYDVYFGEVRRSKRAREPEIKTRFEGKIELKLRIRVGVGTELWRTELTGTQNRTSELHSIILRSQQIRQVLTELIGELGSHND